MLMDEVKIKINEIFHSIQGESLLAGKPTAFIRTSYCNLRCTWCDTKYAYWEGTLMSIPEIIEKIIPECGISSNGLIFYPVRSGNSIIHIEKKMEKIGIQSSQNENINNKSYYLIFNFVDFLKSRVYSYENENKYKVFFILLTITCSLFAKKFAMKNTKQNSCQKGSVGKK